MAENNVLLRSNNKLFFVLIDADHHVTQVDEEEYWDWCRWEAPEPQNEAERKIIATASDGSGFFYDGPNKMTTCGEYTYYIRFGEYPIAELRRMNIDGTGDKLLWSTDEDETRAAGIISVGGKLFCYTYRSYQYDEVNYNAEYQLRLLDEDGKVVRTLMLADTGWMSSAGESQCLKEFNDKLLMYGGSPNISDTGFMALYDPAADALFTLWEPGAPKDRFPGEDTHTLSWATNAMHFFAALDEYSYSDTSSNGELYYAPLDASSLPRRIPLPVAYEGRTLYDVRIGEVTKDSLVIGRCASREDRTGPWALFRVSLDTFVAESLGLGDAPALPDTEPDKALFKTLFPKDEWDTLKLAGRESVPPPDYELFSDYATTPSHIYAVRGGELFRMPIGNIAKQEKVSLPKKYKGMEICGLTEQWLFVSGCAVERDEYYGAGRVTTWRIDLKTFKVKQVDESEMAGYPRYNPQSDSLLYLSPREEDSYRPSPVVSAVNLSTGKRGTVVDFTDYFSGGGEYHLDGWFNAPDGVAALKIWVGWDSGYATCIVFGKDDAIRFVDISEIPEAAVKNGDASNGSPRGEAEKRLAENEDIICYAAHGGYVYYVEAAGPADDRWQTKNLCRVTEKGGDKTLLRAKTNIFRLMEYGGKLHCLADLPDSEGEEFGFYLLDENGKVAQTIAQGWDGEWGGCDVERKGNFILFVYQGHWSSEDSLRCIYDPKIGAVFSTQK